MADVRDYMDAARVTDDAFSELNQLGNLLSEGSRKGDDALATLHAGRVIALAIREIGTRLDYVLRDIERGR